VRFVSITQEFNATFSMVCGSWFAQYEREGTGGRIRDKIAASQRKHVDRRHDPSRVRHQRPKTTGIFQKELAFEALQATKKFHQCRIISPAFTATRRAQPL